MCGIWCTLMGCLFKTSKGSKGEKKSKSKPKLTRNQEIFICIWNVDALRAVLLTVLNIIVIAIVWTSKPSIDQYKETLQNVQTAFNRLGMQLSPTPGNDDKIAATVLVVIECLTIGFNIMHLLLLFWMLNDKTVATWKIKALFSTIGFMHSGILIARVICVERLRPQEFSEFRCCAVHGVKSTTNDFDLTPWCTISGSCQQTNSQLPRSCCKGIDKSSYTLAPAECHEFVYSGYYNEKGCSALWLDAVKDYTDEKKLVFLCGIVAAVSHAVSLIFSLCLVLALLVMNNKQVKGNGVEDTEGEIKGKT